MTPDRLLRLLPFITCSCLLPVALFFPKSATQIAEFGGPASAYTSFLPALPSVCAGLCIWLFERCLHTLGPGAHAFSRLLYAAVLASTPFFVLGGTGFATGVATSALVLAACYQGLHALETRYTWAEVWSALFGGLAMSTYPPLVALLAPLLLLLAWRLLRTRRWGMFGLFAAVLLAMLLAGRMRTEVWPAGPWSAFNFLKKEFPEGVGYAWPNALYALYPFLHPGFCILLPGLWLLAKKTDFRLRSKKVLAAGLVLYLLTLGGLPKQSVPDLLPAYAVVLLLLFPAWDRFVSYGFYFFKRLTMFILCAGVLIQIAVLIWLWGAQTP
jgi:hypothetical protein